MKKLVILTLLGFIIFSCASVQQIVTPVSSEQVDTPIIWKQSYFPEIQIKDSVFFYNPDTIRIEKDFLKKTIFVENGIVKAIDSLSLVSKIIPALTAGRWFSGIISSSGEIKQMAISFSRKKETTYNLIFIKQDDETFLLNKNAYIVFRGYKYPVEISTTGDKKLRFYYQQFTGIKKIKEKAEGWKNSQINETILPSNSSDSNEPTIER